MKYFWASVLGFVAGWIIQYFPNPIVPPIGLGDVPDNGQVSGWPWPSMYVYSDPNSASAGDVANTTFIVDVILVGVNILIIIIVLNLVVYSIHSRNRA